MAKRKRMKNPQGSQRQRDGTEANRKMNSRITAKQCMYRVGSLVSQIAVSHSPSVCFKRNKRFMIAVSELRTVTHACAPRYSKSWGRRFTEAQEFKASLQHIENHVLYP